LTISSDVNKIRDGISEKLANATQHFATCLVSVIIAFVKGWKLTLVLMATSPVLGASAVGFSVVNNQHTFIERPVSQKIIRL
jgi:ATP-binding cassette subfamily B (MDR/TAP) protein 1